MKKRKYSNRKLNVIAIVLIVVVAGFLLMSSFKNNIGLGPDSYSNDLVSYFNFDSNTIDQVSGVSGVLNGQTGSYPTYVEGKKDKALSFDGVDDYMEVEKFSGISDKSFTVSMWINPNFNYNEITASDKSPAWIYWRSLDDRTSFGMYQHNSGQTVLLMNSDNGNDWSYDEFKFKKGNWIHVAAVYDKSVDKISLYVNGVKATKGNGLGKGGLSGSGILFIGKSSYGNNYPGLIDEVTIYNRELTKEEILGIVNGPKSPPTLLVGDKSCRNEFSNLVYHANDNELMTVEDTSNGATYVEKHLLCYGGMWYEAGPKQDWGVSNGDLTSPKTVVPLCGKIGSWYIDKKEGEWKDVENGVGICVDYPVQSFENPITIDGTKLKDGDKDWSMYGVIYGNPNLYEEHFYWPHESLEYSKDKIIKDFYELAKNNINTIYLFGDACDVNIYYNSGYDNNDISIERFTWLLDTAERFGIRVFAFCNTKPDITAAEGGDGFSTPSAIPYFNQAVQDKAFEAIDKYMDNFKDHPAFVGFQALPHKFASNLVVECNNVENCKKDWNKYLYEKYGSFTNLKNIWGSDAVVSGENRLGVDGNIKAGWMEQDFVGPRREDIQNQRAAEARRLDWLEFEFNKQGEMYTKLINEIPDPYHTEVYTFFETYLGNDHRHEYTTPGWQIHGQENYAISTWGASSQFKKNNAFDIGYPVSMRKLWLPTNTPYHSTTAYSLDSDEIDIKEARDYYNMIIPTMFSTNTAGFLIWEFGVPFRRDIEQEFYDYELHDTLSLWGYALKNYNIQRAQKPAEVLVLVNYPEFIQRGGAGENNSYYKSFEANPIMKVPTITNSLMQLGVDYDVKYSSVNNKVISGTELSKYKLVIYVGNDIDYEHFEEGNNFGKSLNDYVKNGGTLFMHTDSKLNHKDDHGKIVQTPKINELILNSNGGEVGSEFTNYYWEFSTNSLPEWRHVNHENLEMPVVNDPLPNSNYVERNWSNYQEIYDNPKVNVISKLPGGHATLLRIRPFSEGGKVILSTYNLAFLTQYRNYDLDKFENPEDSIIDSSQFLWLFEGLLNEADLGDEIEVLGERGDKVYNIKSEGQRLILNEYTNNRDVLISLNDCGYENMGEFILPASGVLLVNSNVVITNARKVRTPNSPADHVEWAIPEEAKIIKQGPDGFIIAEFPQSVSCNGIEEKIDKGITVGNDKGIISNGELDDKKVSGKKVSDKTVIEKILDWFKNLG